MNEPEACSLEKKSCIPCRGDIPPLQPEEIKKFLHELSNNWTINSAGHLFKSYLFQDFMGPMNFANQIAIVAEKEAHHPDVSISWGKCSVEIWTHKINGLTESDFILAAKIDASKK